MKVIFVGFFKTGTKTMNEALRILDYRVSDITRNFTDIENDWWKFFKGKGIPDDLHEMFEGYDATGDAPACFYWQDFLRAFPGVKVILTTRDEESWLKSLKEQINTINDTDITFPLSVFSMKARRWHDFADQTAMAGYRQPASPFSIVRKYPLYEDEVALKAFRMHAEEVSKGVPKDQLLVYNVKEGWEPLCRFLGHDVPDVPFPHLNKGGEIIRWRLKNNSYMQAMYTEMYFNLSIIAIILMIIVVCVSRW